MVPLVEPPTHTPLRPATTEDTSLRILMVATTRLVVGSILETVPSDPLATQMVLPVTASAIGLPPTGMVAVTRSVRRSTRDTVPLLELATHTEPFQKASEAGAQTKPLFPGGPP